LNRKTYLISCIVVLMALAVSGCAIDRSIFATPEALRNLPPPPEVVSSDQCSDISAAAGATSIATEEMTFDEAEMVIEPEANDYYACIVTNRGIIEVTLYDDNAPETVNNFVFLAQAGFYDGVLWHRVVNDFVIQGGDRNGGIAGQPGTGGPGYSWADELAGLALPHDAAGVLSMANAGPNTNGSQFFVTLTDDCCTHLNGRHAVFGKVSNEGGMEVVNTIGQGDLIQTIEIVTVAAS
jgi:peptidyl-prolyl cis-trans isomerase B (cyclophilin B)